MYVETATHFNQVNNLRGVIKIRSINFISAITLKTPLPHQGAVFPANKFDQNITLGKNMVLVAKNEDYHFLHNCPYDV